MFVASHIRGWYILIGIDKDGTSLNTSLIYPNVIACYQNLNTAEVCLNLSIIQTMENLFFKLLIYIDIFL